MHTGDYEHVHLLIGDQVVHIVDDRPKAGSVAEMGAVHTLPAPTVVCPRCGSQDTQKYGIRNGTQEYICSKCRSKFNANDPCIDN